MPNTQKIDFTLVSAQEQPAHSLIVVFHGTGQTVEHVLPYAREMHQAIPGADIICPLGPEEFSSKKHNIRREDGLRTWIRHETTLDHGKAYLQMAFNKISVLDSIHEMIDRELAARHLDNTKLGLFGFSLGGTVALMTAFTRTAAPAAVAAHSGMFFPFRHIKTRPTTLWIMGDKDKRYDAGLRDHERGRNGILSQHFNYFHTASVARIEQAGIPVETRIIPGLDHDISAESLQYAITFLKNQLEK